MKSLIALLAAALTTGCASTATKNALGEFTRVDKAYAQVVDVFDADRYIVRSRCAELKDHKPSQEVCAHLQDFDMARTAVLRLNRFILSTVAVPKTEKVKEGDIIEVDPSRQLAGFKRIATHEPSETCKWDGPITWKGENSLPATMAGFFAGMLVIPTVVLLSSDDILAGGVVCEGWSYKSLVKTPSQS
ncbi:MAG TPA: hypothetical protein VJ698_03635 [Noviherbaspirillum sp.]|uniref:hypothetical protein n=1 Tax=Noviherbaspirillum sp. TaxID=1926288 RepID=UPI002B495C0C|nr:hypothetical protein [Noviherbaspirillum sp.]HJV84542.1 hypothetical protein [Noviherbaspirillum sp.]